MTLPWTSNRKSSGTSSARWRRSPMTMSSGRPAIRRIMFHCWMMIPTQRTNSPMEAMQSRLQQQWLRMANTAQEGLAFQNHRIYLLSLGYQPASSTPPHG